jgi:CRP/FNR family transcriptional regulator
VPQLLCRALADVRSFLLVIRDLDSRARLAWFLLNLATRLTPQETLKCNFRLSMDRNDIANYLGLTIGTVSRTLTDYQKAGILSARGKSIQILDVQALRKMSGTNPTITSLARH